MPFISGYLSTFLGKYAIFLGKNLEEWGKVAIFAAVEVGCFTLLFDLRWRQMLIIWRFVVTIDQTLVLPYHYDCPFVITLPQKICD